MTSREAAAMVCGEEAVRHHELVETFYTKYGPARAEAFAAVVNGRVDAKTKIVTTPQGDWVFRSQRKTTNSTNAARDLERVAAGHIVQLTGTPEPGRISVVEWLRRHGIKEPERVCEDCAVQAAYKAGAATHDQLGLVP